MDELMMDWLYEELDPSSSARLAEHVGACARCSAEVGALRRTREAFRDLSEFEPPGAITAILLHEAARRAPAAVAAAAPPRSSDHATPRFGERLRAWFRPLVMHPAVTALATLVLVAGVAGTLYLRRGADMARPRPLPAAPAPAQDPAASAPAEPEKEADEEAAAPGAEEPADKVGASGENGFAADLLEGKRQAELKLAQEGDDDQAKAQEAELDVAERQPIEPDQAAPARRPKPEKRPEKNLEKNLEKQKTAKVAAPEETRARGAAGRQRGALDEPPASNAVSGAGQVAGDLAAESSQAATSPGGGGAAATATPEAPGPRDDSADRKSDADGRYRPYRDKPLSKKEQGWLDGQEMKLSELARNKRCREAAAIANDILDRNPEFYTRRIGGSKQMEPCRWYVGQEQKRRAARRVQAPQSTKSSGGAQQKVRAAPAKDEAAAKEKQ